MKKLVYLIVMIFMGTTLYAQDTGQLSKREQRKLAREQRKQEAEEAEELKAQMVDLMMDKATFVLEADMLFNKYGESQPVSSTINFIMVDSTNGVLQVGSPYYLGQNGVGGVTIEGTVANYEESKNEKRGTYNVEYTLRSPMGIYDVNLSVSETGRADARVSGNFSGSLRYSGTVVHPANSRVYKGMASY